MTQSEESSKSFQERLRFLDETCVRLGLTPPARQSISIPPAAPSTLLTQSGGSRRPLTWSKLSRTNTGSLTPMWRLAGSGPRPPKPSARQRIGTVRYLAGTRPWTPRPRWNAARPTAPTSLRIEFPKSAGREPYTRTVDAVQDALTQFERLPADLAAGLRSLRRSLR